MRHVFPEGPYLDHQRQKNAANVVQDAKEKGPGRHSGSAPARHRGKGKKESLEKATAADASQ